MAVSSNTLEPAGPRSGRPSFAQRFARNHLAVVGLVIVLGLIFTAIFAHGLVPHDPNLQRLALKRQPPGLPYLLGTDEFGRDILSRLILGSRVALVVALGAVAMALSIGTVLGLAAGYIGGRVDDLIMRLLDLFLAFPPLLLALAIVATLGQSVINTTIAVGVYAFPIFARLVRSAVLSAKERDYVQAAKALGASNVAVVARHILPNVISPIIVYATLYMSHAILFEASLSFLGLGVQPPNPSWGQMVASGRDFLHVAPHIATIPGLAIMLSVLGFNLLGDGLRDMLDPRLQKL